MNSLFDKDGATVGIMLSEFGNPNIVRIFHQTGFQYVIIDDEHGYFDFTQIAALIGVASGYQFPVIVRVPGVSREYITKLMDMGAAGVLVPMVNTPEQAKEIVSYAKYTPIGCRGISTTRAHTNYNPPPLSVYMEQANRNTYVCVQLETGQGVENAESIAATEGVDVLFIGPNDLAADLGVPGDVNNPAVYHAIERAAEAGRKYGKPVGVITGNQKLIDHCKKCGISVYSVGSELDMLVSGCKSRLQNLNTLLKEE